MLIAIPSKGRAGANRSGKYMPTAKLFVPANERGAYEAVERNSVVAVPNEVRGITATRNWILDWAQERDESQVVMIDDDLRAAGWVKLHAHNAEHQKLSWQEMVAEWERLFEVAEDTGYRIWGLATDGATRSIYPYAPFVWRTYVTASCMGIRNDTGIRFDESFPVKEDYELTLRCIKEDGGVVGCRYMYWQNKHWEDEGGCKAYRTQEMEDEAIRRLMEMYPGIIRRVTRGGSGYSIELEF